MAATRTSTVPLASGSIVLVSFATIALIAVVRLLDLPGGRGPIQYAVGHSLAKIVFLLRSLTMLAMMGIPCLAVMLAIFGSASLRTPQRIWWRILALGIYVLAWMVLINAEFFPTV